MRKPKEGKPLSSNAGRWVARVRGKIVAQGETADQASQSARKSRPKEVPEIIFTPYPEMPFNNLLIASVLESLPLDQVIYLVGGAVRDFILNRETHDLDFVVPADGIKAAKRVSKALGGAFFILDKENDIGRVVLTNADQARELLDFSSYRGETLESDLRGRDFSINALALNLRSHQLVDPVDGLHDLKEKRIRACTEHSIVEDPVRILRAVRLAALLGFRIQRATRQLLRNSVDLLPKISPERVRDELFKILNGPRPSTAIRALDILGALPYVLPETLDLKAVTQPAPHVHDVWEHTLAAMDHLESIFAVLSPGYEQENANDLWTGLLTMKLGRFREQFQQHFAVHPGADRTPRSLLFFSVLYHDIAKPTKKKIDNGRIRFHGHDEEGALLAVKRAIKLRLSNAEMDRVRIIIRNHMRLLYHINRLEHEGKHPTRRAVYRFFRDAREAGVDLCLLALADQRATYGAEITQATWTACLDIVRLFLENWWEKREETISPPPLINGDDLIASLKLHPGPELGELLEAIREAQAMGIVNSREEALAVAKDWISDHPSGKRTKPV